MITSIAMTDLSQHARRFGYRFDGSGINVRAARIAQVQGQSEMTVSTCDEATMTVLLSQGRVLFVSRGRGYATVSFSPRKLGEVITAIERCTQRDRRA